AARDAVAPRGGDELVAPGDHAPSGARPARRCGRSTRGGRAGVRSRCHQPCERQRAGRRLRVRCSGVSQASGRLNRKGATGGAAVRDGRVGRPTARESAGASVTIAERLRAAARPTSRLSAMNSWEQRERARLTLAKEVGYVTKPHGDRLRVALAFPNTY